MDNNYILSNKVESVKLNSFRKTEYKKLLNCIDYHIARELNSQELIDYLCGKFGISKARVQVLNRVQNHSVRNGKLVSKTYGTYNRSTKVITIFNLTAKQKKVVSIKTFADTLLHEFIHHYDYEVLNLFQSVHSGGFYKRISDLKNKLD